MKDIKIVIVDDHKLIRDSLSQILNNHHRFEVVAACSNAEEGVQQATTHQPHVVITDINMPGMNGFDAMALIKEQCINTKIIGMSLHTQPSYALRMIRGGALGYVTKNSPLEELFKALDAVLQGKRYLCDQIKNALTEQAMSEENGEQGFESLSERELEIINFIRRGLSSKEIASELFISKKTVEVHRYNILKKLNLTNAAALVNFINTNYYNEN
jgi:two-component system invasion response regulator UvrY